MAVKSWRAAVRAIEKLTGPVTRRQRRLATLAGIALPGKLPAIVAAARLREALSQDLHFGALVSTRVRYDTEEYLADQWKEAKQKPPVIPTTQNEAEAWVEYLFLIKRRANLNRLRPHEGDIVANSGGSYVEVSSIGENGRLYFKGGGGQGAWPDRVVLVARLRDKSTQASEARTRAQNTASRPSGSWSLAREEDLRAFQVTSVASHHEIEALEEVIDTATDERPIQEHLQKHPRLLCPLLQRTPRYVIPLKRLGSEFVPDFVIGDVDSMGIHWYLLELESPRAPVYLANEKSLSAQARKGVEQVTEWRKWLQDNIAYARQSRRENGLGLFDIRPDTRALVLVGRRSSNKTGTDAARLEARATSNVHIHTYDWLLDSIRGSSDFLGPSAMNSYALPRDR